MFRDISKENMFRDISSENKHFSKGKKNEIFREEKNNPREKINTFQEIPRGIKQFPREKNNFRKISREITFREILQKKTLSE